MLKNSLFSEKQNELINYLIEKSNHSRRELPPINQISQDLGISTANLREQMELLKIIGVVSAKPRKGLQLLEYRFTPAVLKSLYYAVRLNYKYFSQFSEIRNHLEKSFFIESVKSLSKQDIYQLEACVNQAKAKMSGDPIQIPHLEHRNFHLAIYSHIGNVFLTGILEAYWDTYELVGLHVYTDLVYLEKVWTYHQMIVDEINVKKYHRAYELLIEHMELIYTR